MQREKEKMRITLSIGGSVLIDRGELNTRILREVANVVKELRHLGHQVYVVVGGGEVARKYIEAGRKLGLASNLLDEIGIAVTRLNAKLVSVLLGHIAGDVPTTIEAAIERATHGKVPVMGGTAPGQTTDAVAAALAHVSGSDLLIFITDVDGIYTADPKKDPSAQKIIRLTTKDLLRMFGRVRQSPGMNVILDSVAVKLISRYKLKTLVLPASDLERLPRILAGEPHSGTTVEPVE
jgi:uridylate kinase